MPGRGLSRHGGGEYEMDTELQTKTVRRLPAWLGCCPELPLSLTAASLLLADTLIPGRSAVEGERGCLSLCVCTHASLCAPQPETLCVVRYQRESCAVVSGVWGFKHPPERAWGGMHAGPQTGACGKIRLVHVSVNPRSECALCVPMSHEGSMFTRMVCEFVHRVLANDLRIVCVCVCACLMRACGAWGYRLRCAVRGTDRGCGQTRTRTQIQEASLLAGILHGAEVLERKSPRRHLPRGVGKSSPSGRVGSRDSQSLTLGIFP